MSDYVSPRQQAAQVLRFIQEAQNSAPAYTSTPIMQPSVANSSGAAAVPHQGRSGVASGQSSDMQQQFSFICGALADIQQQLAAQTTALANVNVAVNSLKTDVASINQQLQQVQADQRATNNRVQELDTKVQQLTQCNNATMDYVKGRCLWIEQAMQMQLAGADNPQRLLLGNTVILKPGQGFTNFNKLTTADTDNIFRPPPGQHTIITARVVKHTDKTQPKPVWTPDNPCDLQLIEVQLPPGIDARQLVDKREDRNKFLEKHRLVIKAALTDMEKTQQKHLQQHAMGALIAAGITAGWRRGQITWMVPGTGKYGLMTMQHIPANCEPQFVLEQWHDISRAAAPGVDIPMPRFRSGTNAGAGAGGSNTPGPEAAMPDVAV